MTAHSSRLVRVVHIINGLRTGGAELTLFRLISEADRSTFDMQVISLLGDGPVGAKLRQANVPVECWNLSSSRPNPYALIQLARSLRFKRPDVVQTWLPHSDLLGGIAAKLAGIGPVVWNVRYSTLHAQYIKWQTRTTARACALLSPLVPAKVVCCSESSKSEQLKLGYYSDKMIVIPNGVDTALFRPDVLMRHELRHELRIQQKAVVIGASGRFHPQKDYQTFVRAAAIIAHGCPDAEFVICGDGITSHNSQLEAWVRDSGCPTKFHLLARRDDMPRFMAGLDLFVSSARFGEGFPNVVSEAMACGVPCVVTNVGDSALIVGETGRVVPIENPDALARACLAMLGDTAALRQRGLRARDRIAQDFSLVRMVKSYEQLYAYMASPAMHGADS